MKKSIKKITALILASIAVFLLALPVFAENEAQPAEETVAAQAENEEVSENKVKTAKAWAAGIAIMVVAATAAIGMAFAISKSSESIARQPEAAGNIRTSLMLGLVFIETAIIYALIVAILIVFVL